MEIEFTPEAYRDLIAWKESGNEQIVSKINALIEAIVESPFKGIGKPEALKYDLRPKWSRRINKEHRLIYEVKNDVLYIFSLKGHYEK